MTGPACDAPAVAAMLRALAHPMRLTILCRLLEGEAAVSAFEAELGLRQPSLSQQLALLREAKLVATRREAKTVFYRLDDARVAPILGVLQTLFQDGEHTRRKATMRPAIPQPTAATVRRRAVARDSGMFARAGWPQG
jgi:ArsR family transcriptional regulator